MILHVVKTLHLTCTDFGFSNRKIDYCSTSTNTDRAEAVVYTEKNIWYSGMKEFGSVSMMINLI